ncbi:hypothetical protein [Streptosporangium sp. NPDC051022]|uniref:hypothetical protein n=1 Tax=Streptosporangium sp. NPDC051022 TaxID=3155752 RepID=UPI0034338A88
MSHSRRQSLARQRVSYTGETHNQARHALGRLHPAGPPIPHASLDQAALEAALFLQLGRIDHSPWPTGAPAFGVTSLTPYRDELVIRIAKPFLPDVIAHIMPTCAGDDSGEIYGVVGLRAHPGNDHVILYRPGVDGRIRIPVRPADWDKAALVGLGYWWEDVQTPWLTHPVEWHPAERAFIDAWPRRLAIGGDFYRDSAFISALLRRVHLLHGTDVDYWQMWINSHPGEGYDVHLLWANGGEHTVVVDRLRDPLFGLDFEDTALHDQLCECGPDVQCYIKLIHHDAERRHRLFLRRSTEARRGIDDCHPSLRSWEERQRQRREQLCATYGY